MLQVGKFFVYIKQLCRFSVLHHFCKFEVYVCDNGLSK